MATDSSAMEVRELRGHQELKFCEEIQRSVWRLPDSEMVPVGQLQAAWQAGGLIAGAWVEGRPVGFSYAFPARRTAVAGPGLHSHMTAVLPEAQGRGVGGALKWFQRRWSLERGIDWIEWTFDPLRAANARFNLERLGARASEYLVDAYGPMDDALNRGLPSDRLVALWELRDPQVAQLAAGVAHPAPAAAAEALSVDAQGEPGEPDLDLVSAAVKVFLPADVGSLLQEEPAKARRWRERVRMVLLGYLQRDYVVTRFVRGGYLLERAGPRQLESAGPRRERIETQT